jgi:hypothetical protein
MGTIRNGANGGFSGKAGSIVGSSWNNINYIKGLSKISNKPASQKQLDQRARFATVLAYLGPIKDILIKGWKGQTANRATGFNMGVQHALSYAVAGDYPDYEIDKSLVQVSKGTLQKYASTAISSPSVGKLTLDWQPQVNKLNAFEMDVLFVLLYNEAHNLFLPFPDAGLRKDGTATLDIPAGYAGQTLHAYLFYISPEGNRQSNSAYVGPITI